MKPTPPGAPVYVNKSSMKKKDGLDPTQLASFIKINSEKISEEFDVSFQVSERNKKIIGQR